VYGSSYTALWKLDTATQQVSLVAPFSNAEIPLRDIAIDHQGAMVGASATKLYAVDPATAACSLLAQNLGGYPNSLSFVPKGTVDPNAEALVGFAGSTYVRIDLASGAVSAIGNLGSGYQSSGDLVSIAGGPTLLTVVGNGCGDCLVEVDPKTGSLVKLIGPLGFAEVWGLAYTAGKAFGFDGTGHILAIDVATAQAALLPFLNEPLNLSFYGGGATTAASP
jgi:hypothetical protein